jgi:hypothetical protein
MYATEEIARKQRDQTVSLTNVDIMDCAISDTSRQANLPSELV